jgi:hypothetical protein
MVSKKADLDLSSVFFKAYSLLFAFSALVLFFMNYYLLLHEDLDKKIFPNPFEYGLSLMENSPILNSLVAAYFSAMMLTFIIFYYNKAGEHIFDIHMSPLSDEVKITTKKIHRNKSYQKTIPKNKLKIVYKKKIGNGLNLNDYEALVFVGYKTAVGFVFNDGRFWTKEEFMEIKSQLIHS